MATTELTIRQLADEGGTAPIAPITVTDAVLKGDGTTLTEELTALNNGLKQIKSVTITFDAVSPYDIDTKTVDVSSNPATFGHIVGWEIYNTTFLVPIQLYFSDTNKIKCRVTNFTDNQLSAGTPIVVFYVQLIKYSFN